MKAINNTTTMSREDRDFITSFTKKHCRPHAVVMAERLNAFVYERQMALLNATPEFDLLAAGTKDSVSSPIEAMTTPNEPVRFVFAADNESWKAEIIIPPKADVTTQITVSVYSITGDLFKTGVFKVSGQEITIRDGVGEMAFGMFLAGLKNPDVSFSFDNNKPSPGKLMFF